MSERLEKVREIFLKMKLRRDPSSWVFFLKILGQMGWFTWFRSQGTQNRPEKLNIKIN